MNQDRAFDASLAQHRTSYPRSRLLVVAASLWATVPLPAQAQSGPQVSVSDSGAATYSYPLNVPPGIAGMSPKLGLAYFPSGINGPVGTGWSVQAISTITRCPAIAGTDGSRAQAPATSLASYGVKFAPTDKLCLDGQRLIQTSSAGAATAFPQSNDSLGLAAGSCLEFRTEKDTYARILACGTAGSSTANGPAYFKVWTKSGLIYEYGVDPALPSSSTSNAQIAAQGSAVIAVWAVSHISDTVGNFMDFKYEQRTTNWGSASGPTPGLEWNLLEIQYTGNGSQVATNKVVLCYQDRADLASSGKTPINWTSPQDRAEAYHQGSKNISIRRLWGIRTYVNWPSSAAISACVAAPGQVPAAGAPAGAVEVKAYLLTYAPGVVTGRSTLSQIQECSGQNESICLPPTTFAYSSGSDESYIDAPGFNLQTLPVQTIDGTTGVVTSGAIAGDFRGIGREDLILWNDLPANNAYYKSNGDGSFTKLANGTGPGQFNITNQNLFASSGCYTSIVADFNGDGLADILEVTVQKPQLAGCYQVAGASHLYLSNGDGSFTATAALPPLNQYANTYIQCTSANSELCANWGLSTPGNYYTGGWTLYVADLNGDGYLDIVSTQYPQIHVTTPPQPDPCASGGGCTQVYLGSATGAFTQVSTNVQNISLYSSPVTAPGLQLPTNVADIDGDGLTDLINLTGDPFTTTHAWRSRGDGNFDPMPSFYPCSISVDVNGDGRTDCIQLGGGTAGANALWVSSGNGYVPSSAFNLVSSGQELGTFYTGFTPTSISSALVDINGDGRTDILRVENTPANNAVFISNGDGTFHKSTSFNLTTANDVLADGGHSFLIGDFTGHGNTEILRFVVSPSTTSLATQNRLYVKATKPASGPAQYHLPPDLLVAATSPTGSVTTLSYGSMANSVANSAARLDYGPATSAGGLYTSDRGSALAGPAPMVDIATPGYVVQSLTQDSGVGAAGSAALPSSTAISTQYAYTGLKMRNDGRGPLGFRNVQRQVVAPNGEPLTISTDYMESWPYTGLAWRSRTFRGSIGPTGPTGVPISEADYVYCEQSATPLAATTLANYAATSCAPNYTAAACTPGNPYVYRPYLNQSTECGWDLAGTSSSPVQGPQLPTVTTTYSPWTAGASPYTTDGDPQVITVTTSGASPFGVAQTFTKTTTNKYQADNTSPGNWLIGRLASATVQNTVPNMNLGTGSSQLKSSAGTGSTAQSGTATPLALTVSPSSVRLTQSSTSFSGSSTLTLAGNPTPPLSFSWVQLSQSGPAISESGPASSTTLATSFTFAATLSASTPNATANWQVTATDAAGRTASAQVPVSFTYQPPTSTATLASLVKSGYGADYSTSPNNVHVDSWWSWPTETGPTLTFRNDGNASMTLSGIGFSAGGTLSVASNNCSNVAPGSSCTMALQETSGTMGSISGTWATIGATVNASGPYTNIVYAGVSHWSTSALTFSTNAGTSQSQTVTLVNNGIGTANWSGALINLPAGYTANTSACSAVASGGGSCLVTITFTPSAAGSCPTYCASNISPTNTGMTGYPQDALSVSGTGVAASLSPTISPSSVSLVLPKPEAASASVTASATGGTGGVTYAWAPTSGSGISYSASGATQAFAATLASWSTTVSETFQVTATDSSGHTAVASIPVTFSTPAQPAVTINPTSLSFAPAGPGTASGGVTLTGSGGTGGYSYSWAHTSGTRVSVSGTNPATFSVNVVSGDNATETFVVTMTDSTGNSATASLNVTFVLPHLAVSISPPSVSLTGVYGSPNANFSTSFTGTVSGGSAPITYAWTSTGSATLANQTTATLGLTESINMCISTGDAGTATLNVTDSKGNTGSGQAGWSFSGQVNPRYTCH